MPREVILLGATSADVFGVLLLGDVTLHPVAISLTGFQKYDAGVDPASLTTGPLFVILVSEPVPIQREKINVDQKNLAVISSCPSVDDADIDVAKEKVSAGGSSRTPAACASRTVKERMEVLVQLRIHMVRLRGTQHPLFPGSMQQSFRRSDSRTGSLQQSCRQDIVPGNM